MKMTLLHFLFNWTGPWAAEADVEILTSQDNARRGRRDAGVIKYSTMTHCMKGLELFLDKDEEDARGLEWVSLLQIFPPVLSRAP